MFFLILAAALSAFLQGWGVWVCREGVEFVCDLEVSQSFGRAFSSRTASIHCGPDTTLLPARLQALAVSPLGSDGASEPHDVGAEC